MFFIGAFYRVENVPVYSSFIGNFYRVGVLNSVKCFFVCHFHSFPWQSLLLYLPQSCRTPARDEWWQPRQQGKALILPSLGGPGGQRAHPSLGSDGPAT